MNSPAGTPRPRLLTRRQFATGSAALAGAVLARCASRSIPDRSVAAKPAVYHAPTETTLPMLEVSGSPYEIGQAIGKRFSGEIKQGFEARGKWWTDLKTFAEAQPKNVMETFVAAARKHAPSAFEELRGWADGSGLPLNDMLILNLKAEFAALRDGATGQEPAPAPRPSCSPKGQPGCSTIALHHGNNMLLAHNEDGDKAYEQRMFMLRVHPRGKPSYLCASYPGILPGNAPWVNDRGIIMTTNFIYTKEVRLGVGRYFLDRLAMEAKTLDEALDTCRHPERAYAFHHVLASVNDRRILSLEVTPTRHQQKEISAELFIHTNHLVLDELAAEAQDPDYVGASSMTRWNVLSKWKDSIAKPDTLTGKQLVEALASHEGRPYSPCRHPEGKIGGSTLLTALFDLGANTMRVYKNQPCLELFHDYPLRGVLA